MATTHPDRTKSRPADMAAEVNAMELPIYGEMGERLEKHLESAGHLAAVLIDLERVLSEQLVSKRLVTFGAQAQTEAIVQSFAGVDRRG